MVITSLAILIQQQRFKKIMHDFLASPTLIAAAGCFYLIVGLIILVPHHLWVAQWPVIVTIVGWIAMLMGLMCLFFPETFVKHSKDLLDKTGSLLLAWVWFLIGLYLMWAGFTQ
jgi:hypothetical protein